MTLPPGPRAPRPLQTVRWLRKPLELFDDCDARHGDFFTLRLATLPPFVFTSDPETIKALFAADRENSELPPGRTIVLEPIMGPKSVLLQEGEEHLRRRKLMLPAFHGERMRAYEQQITAITERHVAAWPRGTPFPLHPRFQALTLDVILAAVFGVSEGDRADCLRALLGELLALTSSPATMALGVFARRFRRLGPWRRLTAQLAEIDELLAAEIAARRADPALAAREDILSMLVAAEFDDGTTMDDSEIRDQLMTLLLAGHETTATALAWTFDLLFRAPAAARRLEAELASADGHDYVDAVAKEALRLRPVIPMVGRRIAAPQSYGGWELPAGTDVFPAIYLVHMREDLYERPREFRPERFLGDGVPSFAWIPFGGGTRRCLGAAFAQFEMRVVLETALREVELLPASDAAEGVTRRNVTLSPRRGTVAIAHDRPAAASASAPARTGAAPQP